MKIRVDNIDFNVVVDKTLLNSDKIPLICLHGFSGSSKDWEFFSGMLDDNFFSISIDLLGHGQSDSPKEISFYTADAINYQINCIVEKLGIKKFFILGYSMGGRAALNFAVNFPESLFGLILESSTPGINEEKLRNERIEADAILADSIAANGIDWFVNYWADLPLFNSLKKLDQNILENHKNRKYENNTIGLKNSLLAFGTGSMPNLWKKINSLNNILLINGELDEKFTMINKELKKILNCQHKIVKGSGHIVHLEKSDDFIILLNKFLRQHISK